VVCISVISYSHLTQSVYDQAWVNRNLPKLGLFVPRLFPTDDDTIATSLFTLGSPADLIALFSKPAPNEASKPSALAFAQAKASAPGYHAKIMRLLANAEEAEKKPKSTVAKAKALGSTKQAALDALSGKHKEAHVTAETKIDWRFPWSP
jgi:hypothetical protein